MEKRFLSRVREESNRARNLNESQFTLSSVVDMGFCGHENGREWRRGGKHLHHLDPSLLTRSFDLKSFSRRERTRSEWKERERVEFEPFELSRSRKRTRTEREPQELETRSKSPRYKFSPFCV